MEQIANLSTGNRCPGSNPGLSAIDSEKYSEVCHHTKVLSETASAPAGGSSI